MSETLPTVTSILATRDRPQLLARAVRSILAQDYHGAIEVIVVFDQSEPQPLDIGEIPPNRSVTVVTNDRTPGLMGARNSGIIGTHGEYIAFCDDDDEWEPNKISAQIEAWNNAPGAVVCATGMAIYTTGTDEPVVRIPAGLVTQTDLIRTRVAEIHPSSTMYRRADLEGPVGLVDEKIPGGYGEDYELILRATRHGTVTCVTEPLVRVHWDRPSFFAAKWALVAEGLTYVLDVVPEFSEDKRGRGRVRGQVAFAHAAVGNRKEARRWVKLTLSDDWRQPRAYLALAVAFRLASARRIIAFLNKRGKGI